MKYDKRYCHRITRHVLDLCVNRSVLRRFDINLYAIFLSQTIGIQKWIEKEVWEKLTGDK